MDKLKDASAIYKALVENNVVTEEGLTEGELLFLLDALLELISVTSNKMY